MPPVRHFDNSLQSESACLGTLLHRDLEEPFIPFHRTLEHGGSPEYHSKIANVPLNVASGSTRDISKVTKLVRREHSTPNYFPVAECITGQLQSDNMRMGAVNNRGGLPDYRAVSGLMKSQTLSDREKLAILSECPHYVLDNLYEQHTGALSLRQPSVTGSLQATPAELNEGNYLPLDHDNKVTTPDLDAPPPIYPVYVGHFRTAQDAKAHRKRTRIAPKSHALDIERVKCYGRQYWVRRIYEAMVDITAISDGDSSIHRQRFTDSAGFDPMDLEATAHHVFDSALAVHERGWTRPKVYHKKVVRGKLTDVSERSLETRLARICLCLKQKKATVDDALRGGVTLALLCDNPEARGFTKISNNTGNKKRGERLRLVKGTDQKLQQQGKGAE